MNFLLKLKIIQNTVILLFEVKKIKNFILEKTTKT
jgi:hypothetical protein